MCQNDSIYWLLSGHIGYPYFDFGVPMKSNALTALEIPPDKMYMFSYYPNSIDYLCCLNAIIDIHVLVSVCNRLQTT